MKECPKCHHRPITFGSWARGTNAFRYRCDSCKADLRCNAATIVGFILTLAVGFATLVAAATVFGFDLGRGKAGRYLFMLVPIVFGGALTWLLAGYKVSEGGRQGRPQPHSWSRE